MLIRTPYIRIKPQRKENLGDGISQVFSLVSELNALRNKLEASVTEVKNDLQNEKQENRKTNEENLKSLHKVVTSWQVKIDKKLQDLDFTLSKVLEIQKGEKGDTPDIEPIISAVLNKMPIPTDGKDADEEKIVSRVLSKIKVKDGKDADENQIVEKVIKTFKEKKILKTEHIGDFTNGLEQTIAPIRSLAAGFRGGGDTVTAGTGVTITTNSEGKKVITSTASGFTELIATGSVNSVNKDFTFPKKPSYIVSDGVFYKENKGWTWVAGTLTATMDIPPNDTIWGIE